MSFSFLPFFSHKRIFCRWFSSNKDKSFRLKVFWAIPQIFTIREY